jgi:serine protease AprX
VGATKMKNTNSRADDEVASYSSKGPTKIDHIVKPDLVAPGTKIISVLAPGSKLPTSYPQTLVKEYVYKSGGGNTAVQYLKLSGTSMAAPVVAGAAALLLQKNPSMTPDQVKARLMKTASKSFASYTSYLDLPTGITYNGQSDIFSVGAGYLNIMAALMSNDLVTKAAKSPKAVYNSVTRKVSIVRDLSVVWGDSVFGATPWFGATRFFSAEPRSYGATPWFGAIPISPVSAWCGVIQSFTTPLCRHWRTFRE